MKNLLLMLAHLLATLAKLLGPGGSKAIVADNSRKTFATRLSSRGAAITDVQNLLGVLVQRKFMSANRIVDLRIR